MLASTLARPLADRLARKLVAGSFQLLLCNVILFNGKPILFNGKPILFHNS
jgi:hypothetical protein